MVSHGLFLLLRFAKFLIQACLRSLSISEWHLSQQVPGIIVWADQVSIGDVLHQPWKAPKTHRPVCPQCPVPLFAASWLLAALASLLQKGT